MRSEAYTSRKLPPHLDNDFYREVKARLDAKRADKVVVSEPELPLQEAVDEMKAESPELDTSDAEKYESIKTIIDKVGYALSTDKTMSDAQKLREWVAILKWGVEELPDGYEKTKAMLKDAINNPRHEDYKVVPQDITYE